MRSDSSKDLNERAQDRVEIHTGAVICFPNDAAKFPSFNYSFCSHSGEQMCFFFFKERATIRVEVEVERKPAITINLIQVK